MPSGSKKRKAAKKKKEEEVILTPCHEDSASQHDHGHTNENDDDDISPKTPVQATESDGSSSDEESGSPSYNGSKEEKQIQENSFTDIQGYQYHPVESTDISLGVSDNRSESSSDVLVQDHNGSIESSAPFTDAVELHPEEDRDINMECSAQFSEKYGVDETRGSELDARIDVASVSISSEVGGGDESKRQVLSSEDSLGSQSDASDVSDNDEDKLEVVSSTAVVDPNESVQSLGSADSPSSFQSMNSQQFSEHNSYGRAILTSQEQEQESEGVLETPWKELSSETNMPVSLDHVDDFESPQDQDGQAKSLSKEASMDFKNEEHIHVTNGVHTISHDILEEGLAELVSNSERTQGASLISPVASVTESELICTQEENTLFESNVMAVPLIKNESSKAITEPTISTDGEVSKDDLGSSQVEDNPSETVENATEESASHPQNVGKKVCIALESPQDQDGQANSLFKESSLDFRNEEHTQVSNEVCAFSHATLEEGLTELVSNFEQNQGASPSIISSVAAVTETETTRTVEENSLLESNVMAVQLIKNESSKAITEPMISTDGEINKDDLGSSQAKDNQSDTVRNAAKEAALHRQNVGNKVCIALESPQDQDGQANSLFKESSLDFRNEKHIQVTNEVCTFSHATLEEGLTELVSNSEQNQGASPSIISSVAAVTETETTRTVEENSLLESNVMAVPLIKNESSKAIAEPMISTDGEINKDDLGSSQVEGNTSHTKENVTEESALYPQDVAKKNAILLQREPRTSWMSCCGILDIFTGSHS